MSGEERAAILERGRQPRDCHASRWRAQPSGAGRGQRPRGGCWAGRAVTVATGNPGTRGPETRPRQGPQRGQALQHRTARARPGPAPRRQHRTARARPGTSHGSALAQAQDPAAWPWQGPPQGRLSSTEEPQAKLCLAEFPGADGSHSPARPSAGRSCSPVLAGPLPGDLGRRRANRFLRVRERGRGHPRPPTFMVTAQLAGRAVLSTQKAWLYHF